MVPIRRATSALATRLRSSVRCAMRLIVAAGSRGFLRRRRGVWPPSLTVAPLGTEGSADAVGRPRTGLLGAGPQFGGARLGAAGLLLQLRSQLVAGRGHRAGDLAADRCGGGGVAGAHALRGV